MINKRNIFKRIISILTVVTIIIPTFTQLTISAEETDKYPYNIFGRNGIEINAGNLCINGDVHTNKEANITAYGKNINGKITTGNDIEKRVKHVYADTKIREKYFTENCELYEDGYVKSEMNIHINSPIFSYRNIELDGNVALNSNIGTLMNINVTGEVKNANTSVVYSKYGNITIENDSTANINGLIYAPLGTLTINSPNVSINGIIIADKIIINGNSINLNGNDNIARFIGTESEVYDFSDLEYLPEDWLGDTDEDDLFDIYEKVIDTDPLNPDTDGDKLPDGYEVLTLNTDPLEVDTDENGVSDADEDFDNDNLNNLGEYENKTGPFNPDTDDDGLLDGDEIKKYKTDPLNSDTDNDGLLDGEEGYNGTIYKKNGVYFDPLNPDTNGNGILDGDEVFRQYKKQEVSTYDEAITEINVSMSTNGSLERNLKIESMYGIDAMSSDVFAMIGEPFNFETSTKFNEARITFKIDQSKLGDTEFDNLIILWYNEKEQIFEEMPTTRNRVQSTISTKTTHFSQYMIVDSEKWYANWEASFTELRKMWNNGTTSYKEMNTIFVIDCCSDMETIDSSNQRLNICSNIVNGMMSEDRAAVITYSEYGTRGMTGLTDKNSVLSILSSYIRNSGAKSNLTPAFADAVNIANSSSAEMNRIIILTNGNTQFTLDLGGYNLSNVTVNVVDMGGYTMSEALMNVAYVTGGSVYGIASASDLAYQVGDTIYTPPQFIGEDSDGDGIPDIVELYGLLPNGNPINTNPYLKDTDGDGIPDNEEIHFSLDNLTMDIDKDQYNNAIYFGSDPTKKDTDGDKLEDSYDPFPFTQYNQGNILSALTEKRLNALDKEYNSTPNSNNLIFADKQLQETRDKVITLQKCLEYLGYLDMEGSPYGRLGGASWTAIKLYQINHRMYLEHSTDGIDEATYYSIIKAAFNAGYKINDQEIENSKKYFKKTYTPKSIPPEKSDLINIVKSERSSSIETIYTYDLTVPLEGFLRYGAQDFHFHYYQCNHVPSYVEELSFESNSYDNSSYKCMRTNGDYIWMVNQVKNNAKYDVKCKEPWENLSNTINADVPYFHGAFPFVFRGEEINAEMFGNILFGYICNAGGFSSSIITGGGSLYSKLTEGEFDNPEDSAYILKGYNMYEDVKKDYHYIHITN